MNIVQNVKERVSVDREKNEASDNLHSGQDEANLIDSKLEASILMPAKISGVLVASGIVMATHLYAVERYQSLGFTSIPFFVGGGITLVMSKSMKNSEEELIEDGKEHLVDQSDHKTVKAIGLSMLAYATFVVGAAIDFPSSKASEQNESDNTDQLVNDITDVSTDRNSATVSEPVEQQQANNSNSFIEKLVSTYREVRASDSMTYTIKLPENFSDVLGEDCTDPDPIKVEYNDYYWSTLSNIYQNQENGYPLISEAELKSTVLSIEQNSEEKIVMHPGDYIDYEC